MTRRSATDDQLAPMIREALAEMMDELPPVPPTAPYVGADRTSAGGAATRRTGRITALVGACMVLVLITGLLWVRSLPRSERATATRTETTSVEGTHRAGPAPTVSTASTTSPSVELWTELAPDTAMTIPDAPLSGRLAPASVWTGTEMIVWSGSVPDSPSGEIPLNDGAAFNPTTGRWRTIPVAPIEGRSYPGAVWTGSEMIIWGGSSNGQTLADGAAYNPTTDTWRALPRAPIESAMKPGALWTGDEVIFLGGMRTVSPGSGQAVGDGAAYNPATDEWRPLPQLPGNSLPPYPHAVWTGSTVLTAVATTEPDGPTVADRIQRVRYRPGDPNWEVIDDDATATVLVATPSLGDDIAAVVAPPYAADDPIELLDRNGDLVSTATGRPASLEGHSNNALPIWTGREILFWSGSDFGWAVEPDTGRWRTFPAGNVASRVDGAAVWADGVMLTWGGFVSNQDGTATGGNDGIIYRPPD